MFGSEILEVAIGLAFLFLVLSLFATTVREQIEAILKTRAVHLERGIRLLLNDPTGGGMTQQIYRHPLIYGLFEGDQLPGVIRGFSWKLPGIIPGFFWNKPIDGSGHNNANPRPIGSNLPSYIPSRSFAMALLDLANGTDSSGNLDLTALRATAAAMENTQVGRALVVAAAEAKGDIDRARASLEAWFDGNMDRVSGWYKRESQWILLAIGFILAAALNVDALYVGRELSKNSSLRQSVVAQVQATQSSLAATRSDAGVDNIKTQLDAAKTQLSSYNKVIGWAVPDQLARADREEAKDQVRRAARSLPDGELSAQQSAQVNDRYRRFSVAERRELQDEARRLRADGHPHSVWLAAIVQGWRELPDVNSLWWGYVGEAVLGWVVTAFAIGLGAPFWFDLLNKFMVIRSTVKPYEKSPSEGSEDRQGGRPAATALEPAPGATGAQTSAVSSGAVVDTQPAAARVTLRIAVDNFQELDAESLRVTVNGTSVATDQADLIEVPLAVGVPQQLVIAASRGGLPVQWSEEFTTTLDDMAKPLAITLS